MATQQPSFTEHEIARRMIAAVNDEVITEYHAIPCDAVAKALGLRIECGAAVGFSVEGRAPELPLVRRTLLWPKQRVRFTARSAWILDTQWYAVACEDDDASRTAMRLGLDRIDAYVGPLRDDGSGFWLFDWPKSVDHWIDVQFKRREFQVLHRMLVVLGRLLPGLPPDTVVEPRFAAWVDPSVYWLEPEDA